MTDFLFFILSCVLLLWCAHLKYRLLTTKVATKEQLRLLIKEAKDCGIILTEEQLRSLHKNAPKMMRYCVYTPEFTNGGTK